MVGKWHIGMQFFSPDGEPVELGNKTRCDADNQETLIFGKVRETPRQLFNLKKDPGERVILLTDPSPEMLAKEKELYALLNRLRGDKEWGTDGSSKVPR